MTTATQSPEVILVPPGQCPEGALLLDVRTPVEYAEVHARGAVNRPLAELTEQAIAELRESSRGRCIVLICQSGNRATQAAARLRAAGVENCVVLEGGTAAWVQAGLPVERNARVLPLMRQVQIVIGTLVLATATLAGLGVPGIVWVTAAIGAGLLVAGLTGFCGMALLVARMPWNKGVSGSCTR
jgi:rhodanese-related sulfurtransferase